MHGFEYFLASALLRFLALVFRIVPVRCDRVVLATPRTPALDGNLLYLYDAMRKARPDREYVVLAEPYSYRLSGKLAYAVRLVRGTYYLQTSGLFVVDNAYLPIHVTPPRKGTTVVQVWHATGALKRFGMDTPDLPREPERTFLHRNYDYVVVSGESSRLPYAAALRTPAAHVLALGSPRTDFFFDEAAMAAARSRVLAAFPQLTGRRVVLYAPTFRGRGKEKCAAGGFDAERLRSLLPAEYALVLKTHPNLDPAATPTAGYDAVVDPVTEINDLLTATDILVTDYSSSIFEWALLRKPLVLYVPDLADYEVDPGLYVDYRRDMIGVQVVDVEGIAAAILAGNFDLTRYEEFIRRHLGACNGHASERFVQRFLEPSPLRESSLERAPGGPPVGVPAVVGEPAPRDRLPSHVND